MPEPMFSLLTIVSPKEREREREREARVNVSNTTCPNKFKIYINATSSKY